MAALLIAYAIFLPSTVAQQQPPRQAPKKPEPTQSTAQDTVIKINTNLVQVDAVVKDEAGRIITDLRAEDFEIVENGRARPAEYCSYIPLTEERPAPVVAASDGRLAKNELGRTIVFLVSNPIIDLGIVTANVNGASYRSAPNVSSVSLDAQTVGRFLDQFIEKQMGPRDLVAILNAERDLGVLARFTNNRELLQAASQEIRRQAAEAPRDPLMIVNGRLTSGPLVDRNFATLEMLSDAIEQTRHLPGRKLIVLVARGFLFNPRLPGSDQVRARLRNLTAQANQAHIAIYALDPRGLGLRGGGLQDLDSLVVLANETGGRAIYNTNDFSFGFAEILKENQGYYLLGYDPGESKPAAAHKIKVRVKRPGLQAQARAVAYANGVSRATAAPLGPAGKTDETAERASLAAALETPFALRDIGLSLTPLFLSTDGKQSQILSFSKIDPTGMATELAADGKQALTLEMVIQIRGPDGKLVKQEAKGYSYTLTPAEFDQAKQQGLSYGVNFAISLPGYYQVNAVVRDTRSGRLGNASRMVKVADLARTVFAASSLALSSPEKRLPPISNSNAPPAGEPFAPKQSYARSETLRYQCYVYHARQDAAQSSRLQVQVTIKRGTEIMASAEPRLITLPGGPALMVAGEWPLTGFPPGAYALELVIEDLLHKDSKLTASALLEVK